MKFVLSALMAVAVMADWTVEKLVVACPEEASSCRLSVDNTDDFLNVECIKATDCGIAAMDRVMVMKERWSKKKSAATGKKLARKDKKLASKDQKIAARAAAKEQRAVLKDMKAAAKEEAMAKKATHKAEKKEQYIQKVQAACPEEATACELSMDNIESFACVKETECGAALFKRAARPGRDARIEKRDARRENRDAKSDFRMMDRDAKKEDRRSRKVERLAGRFGGDGGDDWLAGFAANVQEQLGVVQAACPQLACDLPEALDQADVASVMATARCIRRHAGDASASEECRGTIGQMFQQGRASKERRLGRRRRGEKAPTNLV